MLKSKYIIVTITFCLTVNNSIAQNIVSRYEIFWAVWHPFAAIKIKHLLPQTMAVYQEIKTAKRLDINESGGKLDAFRHVYTMAFLCRKLKVCKLRKLGIAHEKGNKRQFFKNRFEFGERPDSLSCVMDLRNNELGFQIGKDNPKLSQDSLKLLVIDQIETGNAWYLKRNVDNNYVTCENAPLQVENYSKSWFVPKCLIKSNE